MFHHGDLRERTVLSCGKDLWLRAGDFLKIPREQIELTIKREDEKALNEKREPDIIEFELITHKEGEPANCHLSHESIELLREYARGIIFYTWCLKTARKNGNSIMVLDSADLLLIELRDRPMKTCVKNIRI
jgi:sRNA-binding carbon storage regulator CsrA